ncbi:MAG: FlgD immunoglobulin-like domain containing protein, partial [bacterium]
SVISDQSPPHTTLKIYNILGQEVRTLVDELKEPGYYTVTWDGRNERGDPVSSGIYFYRLTAGDYSSTKRMVLLK